MKLPDADKLLAELKEKIKSAINETQIIEIKNSFTNKYLASIYEELKYATIQDKKTIGNYLNLLKKQINTIINDTIRDIQTETENKLHLVDYDITINPTAVNPGGLTLTSLIVRDAMIYFNKMGFDIISGSEIVDVKYNFSNLNIDINHPARNASDSFFINISTMLRTQCTAVSAQILEDNTKEDIRVVTFGNVYRNDDDDATHSHQFSQIDIVWLKKDLSIKNLKWLINGLLSHLFDKEVKTRYRLSYFPFTEPSFEVDMQCPNCRGKGCNVCKQTGWIEILGAGILHQNVLNAAHIENKIGLAAGIGIDRLAMIKYGLSDIRDLYSNDFRILNQFRNFN